MSRLILPVAIVSVMALALAACGSETETSPSGEAEPVIPSDVARVEVVPQGGTADNPAPLGALSEGQPASGSTVEEPGTSAAVAAVAAAEASVAASFSANTRAVGRPDKRAGHS